MRYNQRIFLYLFAFYIVVAVGSLFLLNGKGSVFNRTNKSMGAQTAVLSETPVGIPEPDPVVDQVVSAITEEPEPVPEPEPAPEPEPEPEPAPEPEPEPEPVEETPALRYFTFFVNTESIRLNMRTEPSESATIVNKLSKGTKGYVLLPGNLWCYVTTEDGRIGYCSTEYLKCTEVTKEDYPEQYQDMVAAPTEELSEQFGN